MRIEKGQRADVRLSDLFAYALALDVAPIHLLVPLEDEGAIVVTESKTVSARRAREWIRGRALLRDADPRGFFNQLPESEQRTIVEAWLAGGMDDLHRALVQDRVDEVLDKLRSKGTEEADG
jgi:hypothetical protein